MINLDNSKYKPHNPQEAIWLQETYNKINKAVVENGLPYQRVRVGRQVKAYGSRGVNSYKTEIRDGLIGVWINGHHRTSIDIDKVIKHMVKSTVGWKHISDKTDNETKAFLKLKFEV